MNTEPRMSLIHIARNNVVLGQFTDADVAAGLLAGTYLPTDLAWRTGMPQWKSLGEWTEFRTAPAGTTVPPVPPPAEGLFDCPAWEQRNGRSAVEAYFASVKQIVFQPETTFSRLNPVGGIGRPFLFYLIGHVASSVCSSLAAYANPRPFARFLAHGEASTGNDPFASLTPAQHAATSLGAGLFCAPIGVFLCAGILHLMLMLWRGCNRPFEATLRAYLYASGAFGLVIAPLNLLMAHDISALPSILLLMAAVCWLFVVNIIAITKIHRTSVGKVIGAFFTPGIACCCLYFIIVVLAVGVFGALRAAEHAL